MSTSAQTDPSFAGTAVAGALAVITVGLFVRTVSGVFLPTVIGIVGGICLTVSLRIVDSTTGPVGRLLASLLSVPVAGGFVAGVVGTTLLLTGSFFPVENASDVSVATLLVMGNLGVVVGSGVAVFGVTLGASDVIAADSLTAYTRTTVATAVVPIGVGFVLVSGIALSTGGPAATEFHLGDLLGQAWSALVSPQPPQLHLSSFLIAVGTTGVFLSVLVRRSPFESLLASWAADEQTYRRWAGMLSVPRLVTTVAVGALPVAMVLELTFSPAELEQLLGPQLFGLIQLVTTAGLLRLLLLGTTVAAGGWILGSLLLGYVVRMEQGESAEWLAPFGVGLLFTLIAMSFSGPVYSWIVEETAGQLPPEVASRLLDASTAIETVYGETPIVVLLAGLFVGIPAMIGVGLRLAVQFGYLDSEGTGFSLACGGLCLAAVSANIISAPVWLVLGGIVAGLAVWDIGHFGVRLGHEVGPGSTQLVAIRTTATLLVGGAGVALIVGLQKWLSADVTVSATTTLALVSFATALVAFAFALR